MEAEKLYRDIYAAQDDAEAEKRADETNVASDGETAQPVDEFTK